MRVFILFIVYVFIVANCKANIESWIMKTDASLSQETRQLAGSMNGKLQDASNFGNVSNYQVS